MLVYLLNIFTEMTRLSLRSESKMANEDDFVACDVYEKLKKMHEKIKRVLNKGGQSIITEDSENTEK